MVAQTKVANTINTAMAHSEPHIERTMSHQGTESGHGKATIQAEGEMSNSMRRTVPQRLRKCFMKYILLDNHLDGGDMAAMISARSFSRTSWVNPKRILFHVSLYRIPHIWRL